jgi:hypothetical protein
MMTFVNKIKTATLLVTLAVSTGAKAQSTQDLTATLLEGVLTPKVYTGFKGKIQQLDPKWYCDDRRYFWSVNWQAEIKDVQVNFDPANPDVTSVHVVLNDSSVRAQYFQKGGVTCTWDGVEGTLFVGRVDVDFSLKAVASKDFPDISLDGLRISDFQMRNVSVMYASVFDAGFKQSSNGFGEWVETNLNGLIAGFLKTGLKKRLDQAINKEVDRRLKEREGRQHGTGPKSVATLN